MNASKENARKAIDWMNKEWWDSAPMGSSNMHDEAKEFIMEFLRACERKLPHEASFEKERKPAPEMVKKEEPPLRKGFKDTK